MCPNVEFVPKGHGFVPHRPAGTAKNA